MADGSSAGGWVLHPTLKQLGCSQLLLLPSPAFWTHRGQGRAPAQAMGRMRMPRSPQGGIGALRTTRGCQPGSGAGRGSASLQTWLRQLPRPRPGRAAGSGSRALSGQPGRGFGQRHPPATSPRGPQPSHVKGMILAPVRLLCTRLSPCRPAPHVLRLTPQCHQSPEPSPPVAKRGLATVPPQPRAIGFCNIFPIF